MFNVEAFHVFHFETMHMTLGNEHLKQLLLFRRCRFKYINSKPENYIRATQNLSLSDGQCGPSALIVGVFFFMSSVGKSPFHTSVECFIRSTYDSACVSG